MTSDEVALLPVRTRTPTLSNWGAFGDDDEVGTLNYLTAGAVRRGAECVKLGMSYPLNLPVDLPKNRPIGRPDFVKTAHMLKADFKGVICNDDHVLLATQGSSQWDAFAHSGMVENGVDGVFYNGIPLQDVDERGFAKRGGIDKIAQRGIAGRGLLLDFARMLAGGADDPLPLDFVIDHDEYHDCIQHQNLRVESGDIVCMRTGWTETYLASDDKRREELMSYETPNPGISPDLASLVHSERWAALTADNLAVEAAPIRPSVIDSAHVRILRNLGVPFGELFVFRDLAEACAADRRWEFQFVAVPLWIPGGMGSPANAIGIR